MVRGVYQGPAAADPDQAGPLAACLEGLVVDRGGEAMPVREPLLLRLPAEVTDQAPQTDDDGGVSVVTDEAQSPPALPPEQAGPADAHPRPKPSARPRRRA
jgi:hypothetical protein